MDFFPDGFLKQAQARVEAEKLRAYTGLDEMSKNASSRSEREMLIRDCILKIFLAFAEEACALGRQNVWTVSQIESNANEFLRRLTIRVCYEKSDDGGIQRNWTSHLDGSLSHEVEQQFKNSTQWKKFEYLLLGVAETQMKGGRERGPDVETSQKRVAFEEGLRSELGTIRSQSERYATLENLKKQFPDYELWRILSLKDQQELLEKEFRPKAYARSLTAQQFGVGLETIKKDHQKLKKRKK